MFKLIDTDGDGKITHEELKAFHEKKQLAKKAACEKAFADADADHDGLLDFAEFLVALKAMKEAEGECCQG